MPDMHVAKIAVSAATYWIDKPYDYLIPPELAGMSAPGMRVVVPFGKGNRRAEGIILALSDHSDNKEIKSVQQLLDDEPVLTQLQLKLALWMRERFFCTVYDAVKAMLPAGLWFDSAGTRRVGDKTVRMVSLAVPAEEALALSIQKRRSAHVQAELLRILCETGRVAVPELCAFSGAKAQSVTALERAGLVTIETETVYRRPTFREGERRPLPTLNEAQQAVYDGLREKLKTQKAEAALLFGVTGSGKTSVYIRLIAAALESGKSAVLLVPEIALTPQMLETFSSHFGEKIAVLHSSLSVGERRDEWKRIKNGEATVVVGTRSAVFAPVRNLGIMIIDEEQEDTYKSENSPRYHARSVAKYLCAHSNALLLLGSATPNIVSMYAAKQGVYSLFRLDRRFNNRELPAVRIVDMKAELRMGNGGCISSVLRDAIQERVDRGEQSILFLNRRGANKLIYCGECGHVYECPRCSVSLTWHSAQKRLICHYCGYSRRVDDFCPECGGVLKYEGVGTQKAEEELRSLFPGTEVLRMDADSVSQAGGHDVLLSRFQRERIPILIGTQMVAKGLNFENVTLVGVLSADQSLYAGDFHAGERTFSLITQVVGRSGRGEKPGQAIIQTFTPGNQIITLASKQDYDGFFETELTLRQLQESPPFCDLFTVTASGLDEAQVLRCATVIRDELLNRLVGRSDVRVLGPAPLPVVRVNNRYRYSVTLACHGDRTARAVVSSIIVKCCTDKEYRGVSVFADVEE